MPEDLKRDLPEMLLHLAVNEAARAHLHAATGSEIDLACRLKLKRQLAADQRNDEELSASERYVRNALRKTVGELQRMVDLAWIEDDAAFFGRLDRAFQLAQGEIHQKVRGSKAAAVLAINELLKDGHYPTRRQVRAAIEQWRGKRLSDREWRKTFNDPHVSALLQACSDVAKLKAELSK